MQRPGTPMPSPPTTRGGRRRSAGRKGGKHATIPVKASTAEAKRGEGGGARKTRQAAVVDSARAAMKKTPQADVPRSRKPDVRRPILFQVLGGILMGKSGGWFLPWHGILYHLQAKTQVFRKDCVINQFLVCKPRVTENIVLVNVSLFSAVRLLIVNRVNTFHSIYHVPYCRCVYNRRLLSLFVFPEPVEAVFGSRRPVFGVRRVRRR
jgi:hypothetical protein